MYDDPLTIPPDVKVIDDDRFSPDIKKRIWYLTKKKEQYYRCIELMKLGREDLAKQDIDEYIKKWELGDDPHCMALKAHTMLLS